MDAGLGWRKSGEKISKGGPKDNFWNFLSQTLHLFWGLMIYISDIKYKLF
jgi:hypothetical protein